MPEKVMLSLRSFKIECCRTLTNFFFRKFSRFFANFHVARNRFASNNLQELAPQLPLATLHHHVHMRRQSA